MSNIIEIKKAIIEYKLKRYAIRAVTDISLDIKRGKVTALVGESGSGKTTLAASLIQSISEPGKLVSGEIIFFGKGNELIHVNKLDDRQIRKFRWNRISMVFQSAQSALNPVMTIRQQLFDTLDAHDTGFSKAKKEERCRELMEFVKLDPLRVLAAYPHELSGGMKQRVMIAFSLLLNPDLIILDEPTTALDVITQNYIFNLLREINEKLGISMLLLTHDISVVAKFADYIGVMYAGRLMEYGTVKNVFQHQRHPYSEGLIKATPSLIGDVNANVPIKGSPPDLLNLPKGCVFGPRCPKYKDICGTAEPETIELEDGSKGKCFFYNHDSEEPVNE